MLFHKDHNLLIALVCIAKEEDRTIQEWISYHKKIGFTKIFIYENDWKCKIDDNALVKIPFNGKNKILQAYNSWLREYKKLFDWVCFLDCDEFLVLKKHNNINEFIQEYKNPTGIAINWFMFGSMGQIYNEKNRNSLLKRFIYRDKKSDKHIKTILNTKSNGMMVNPHCPSVSIFDTNKKIIRSPFNTNGPTDIVQINHYFYKSFEEWKQRVKRGQADMCVRKIEQWTKKKYEHNEVLDTLALDWFYGKSESSRKIFLL
jgi:hypothetical protein